MMKQIDVFGYGGHSKAIIEIARLNEYTIHTIHDQDENKLREAHGPYNVSNTIPKKISHYFFIAVGNNYQRFELCNQVNALKYPLLIHPKAIVSKSVKIREGTVIMPGAIIQPGVEIGKHCIINSGAVIEHDCIIEDFVHIAPNSSLAGGVKVGKGTLIGIGSSVIPNIEIGSWTTIGAGSVVVSNIESNVTAFGIPCKVKDSHGKK